MKIFAQFPSFYIKIEAETQKIVNKFNKIRTFSDFEFYGKFLLILTFRWEN
jgi:hypothetical protein